VYTEFFGLNEKPFAITPDPRYLYMSALHTDALAHLVYGISESGGFIQLTGEVGTGKTTLIRSLLEQLPEKADIALILSPQLTTIEFLLTIAEELACPLPEERTVKALIDSLNAHLLRVHGEGRRVVLIVDEAQTLSPELLEQVRLLTNLETAKQKLLQIILIGQPELRTLLDRSDMRQIAQRITGRYHLEPLGTDDTAAYVRHRMRVAGALRDVFTKPALRGLYRRSRGVPRLINVIADRALLAAYTRDRHNVDRKLVALAAAEVFGTRRPRRWWWTVAAVAVSAAIFALATTNLWRGAPRESAVSADAAPVSPPVPAGGDTTGRETPILVAAADGGGEAPVASSGEASATAPLSLRDLLANRDFALTADAAIGELLTLWGANYDAARGVPCKQAQEQGLRCLLQNRGTLGELRRVNWPTIMSLVTEDGSEHPVVVAALEKDSAQLVAHGKTLELSLAELGFNWYGDYLLLWRPGNAPSKDLVPGVDDVGVLWLRATLARLSGADAPVDASTVYDAELVRQVRAYQREHKLTVDGIVGELTQIAMLADLKLPNTPLLLAER
jgi:general secretion pathway protein A